MSNPAPLAMVAFFSLSMDIDSEKEHFFTVLDWIPDQFDDAVDLKTAIKWMGECHRRLELESALLTHLRGRLEILQ